MRRKAQRLRQRKMFARCWRFGNAPAPSTGTLERRRPANRRRVHARLQPLDDQPVLARVIGATQLTLPDELLASFPGVDCFNVSEEGGRIVLTPVHAIRLDAVRQKLAELGISEEDVRDAVEWARRPD